MSSREPSLARRLFPAVAITGVGFFVVNALDNPTGGTNSAAVGSDGSLVPNTVPLPTTTTIAPVTENTQAASQATTPATASPQTTAPVSTSACGATSQDGSTATIEHRRTYGSLKVTAKLDGSGKLCDVSVNYSVYDGKSQMYAQRALPTLIQRAVNANSANINGVSGATATSNAFKQSLQAAINR